MGFGVFYLSGPESIKEGETVPRRSIPTQEPTTPWKAHCNKWGSGCGGDICDRAFRIALGRGQLPCQICFVGEAPGTVEDVEGLPFVGPAGRRLDKIIASALPPEIRKAYCNLVGCLPVYEDGGKGEPEPADIKRCRPRLEEFIKIAAPKLIVCVGKLSETWMQPGYKDAPKIGKIPMVGIIHPAHILRATIAQQSFMNRKCQIAIATAWEKVVDSNGEQ